MKDLNEFMIYEAKWNKISKIKVNKANLYATSKAGIECSVDINGVSVKVYLTPVYGTISDMGLDTDEMIVNNKHIEICNTSNNKTYLFRIRVDELINNPKQKDFQWTGPVYLHTELQNTIKDKLVNIINNKDILTNEFIQTFKIL